ncbi:MAG: GNAT family N-acetyltransferase [Phototrophicaceae bacterium]
MADKADVSVNHNPDENRFEVVVGDDIAMVEYNRAGQNIIFTHTEVPVAFEGQGIASKMAYVAMEFAKNEGLKVQALCPFVNKYVSEHPEYHSITWGYTKK